VHCFVTNWLKGGRRQKGTQGRDAETEIISSMVKIEWVRGNRFGFSSFGINFYLDLVLSQNLDKFVINSLKISD
jgi:hypothetical protein